jgi:ribonuclease P protein component
MIGREHRFHGYGSVRALYRRGQTVRGPLMALRFAPRRNPDSPYRVAVVVSRKVHTSAVVRNRIRRRIYEAVRAGGTAPPPATDLIFTVFSDALADAPAATLQRTVGGLLQKAAGASAERT